MKYFKKINKNQLVLFPTSLDEAIEEENQKNIRQLLFSIKFLISLKIISKNPIFTENLWLICCKKENIRTF